MSSVPGHSVPTPPTLRKRTLHPAVIEQCQQLFFRQSFLSDIRTCPQMAFYRWVLNLEESEPFFSAIVGTAGHRVIFEMHERRKWNFTFLELLGMMEEFYRDELEQQSTLPSIAKNFSSLDEQFHSQATLYVEMLQGYQRHEQNHQFNSTLHEQAFVLVINESPAVDNENNDNSHSSHNVPLPYYFTGQLDQGGYYDDGTFALRDIKFRQDAFKPSRVQFDLDLQMTIYSAALKFGQPACNECRPKYIEDEFGLNKKLSYSGPCESCAKLIGTPYWPNKYAERCELIWMRDFLTRKKDEYTKEVIDRSRGKVANPKGRGPKVYPRIVNPKWVEGYKTGDYMGLGFLKTYRKPSTIEVLMSDVLRICDNVRKGVFYRQPGSHCQFWCKHVEHCRVGMELEVQEADVSQVASYGTDDPF